MAAVANPVGTHTGPWTFSQALDCMKAGGRVRRKAWVIAVSVRDGQFWWTVIQPEVWPRLRFDLQAEDVLANDWEEAAT